MVRIGIIGAMKEEIDQLLSIVDTKQHHKITNNLFHVGRFEDKLVVIVQCGIGKINATLCTQLLISEFGVDYVINLGAAGALQSHLNIGDIVVATELYQHDMDCIGLGFPIGVTPGYNSSIAVDGDLLGVAFEVAESFHTSVYLGSIATGDIFVSNKEHKDKILENFNAQCCEMEGYAVAHTCYMNNIPFLVVRAMSDSADDNAQESFEEWLPTIVNNATDFVVNILKNL